MCLLDHCSLSLIYLYQAVSVETWHEPNFWLSSQIYIAYSFIAPDHHGFIHGRSPVTNLCVIISQYVSESPDERGQKGIIYTDFSRAFDMIDYWIPLDKLDNFGLLRSYMSNRMAISRIIDILEWSSLRAVEFLLVTIWGLYYLYFSYTDVLWRRIYSIQKYDVEFSPNLFSTKEVLKPTEREIIECSAHWVLEVFPCVSSFFIQVSIATKFGTMKELLPNDSSDFMSGNIVF